MTHSHDTATPALSVESEYVLVPREPTEAMLNATPASYSSSFKTIWPLVCGDIYRIMIAAAPAPNPSPAAKGGEAVVVQSLRWARTTDPSEGSVHYGTGVFGHRYAASQVKHKAWSVNHHVDGKNVIVGLFGNLADAYTAAQADYTRHICSALATPSRQPAHSDDLAVDRFAVAMKAKLADARAKGKGGWYDETACSQQYLSDELRRHALKSDPLDVANFAMFLHQRNEEIALPPPQPADAVREALETARDYISDAATGTLTYKGSGEGFKAMAAEDLASLDAALAALASDPAPAGEAVEPDDVVVKRIDDMFDAFLDRYATYEGNVSTDDLADYLFDIREAVRSLAHPAPEDTARLREGTDYQEYVAKAIMAFPAGEGLRTTHIWEGIATLRQQRDDARKALETVQAKVAVLDGLLTAEDVWFDYGSGFRAHFSFGAGADWPWQADLHALHAAARSASTQGGE